jgi:transcriptional regulator with XRE-family HTH domain
MIEQEEGGLTQQELAGRLSRPQSFVAKYQGGERRIDVVEFITICRAISVDSVEIIRKLAKLF